jgi:hypothetical protein
MDIDIPVHTIVYTGRVSCTHHLWWDPLTTNNNTPMPDFNNLALDSQKEDLHRIENILDDEDPKSVSGRIIIYLISETHIDGILITHMPPHMRVKVRYIALISL